ncbi:winged helix-turn-helix domain-containing protein [Paraburkholderia madseniana]|jgi:predicted ATPase/DNA-binding winged helix-turn-helix (wHTH) protein|uniref:ATP-binding protein n=1 Tax=Paraburkholderia TaxID=1822464 RepID=UPI0038BD7017
MIKIGRVTVSLDMREVYLDDRLVQVGSRAFDILELLIQARGKTVTKDEILRRVWPNSVVEENNIHVQLSALRRILGADKQAIRTISGRGYRLAIPTEGNEPAALAGAVQGGQAGATRVSGLPICHAPLIGREGAMAEITRALNGTPIVTLLGPGGIGKTQLGIAVARSIAALSDREVCFITLAAVENAQRVVSMIAEALGVGRADGDVPLQSLVAAVQGRKLLVVLDNCEHVIESAATVCELLVQASADLRILTTSREPLRTRDEKFYWVAPLDTPGAEAGPEAISDCSSVRMFLAQMRALNAGVDTDPGSLDMVATICRRLDGLPLALELAAARAAVFGIRKTVSELDDRFQFLTGGRRTAPPRQQTLEATLDWSYQLLSATERTVLHRLGILPARFSLDAACAVAACQRLSPAEVTEAIVGLASKCVVMTTFDSRAKEYFLLESTREYALRKLYESDEADDVLTRNAAYLARSYQQPYERGFRPATLGSSLAAKSAAAR